MARKIIDSAGAQWEVGLSGRRTQYGPDEVSVAFRPTGGTSADERYARFSPRHSKAAEIALEELSDTALVTLLGTAQPAWTSPDGSYGRSV